MFDWLFKEKDESVDSLLDIISVDIQKMNIHKFAIEKAVSMIAKAVARSEIVVLDENRNRNTDDIRYYRLNIAPNDNEAATEFWEKVVKKMLLTGECAVCRLGGGEKLFFVQSYQEDSSVINAKKYSSVVIEVNSGSSSSTLNLEKTFTPDDFMVFRYQNSKIKSYLVGVISKYDATVSAINEMLKLSNVPKFKNSMEAQTRIVEQGTGVDGSDKLLTKVQYEAKLKKLLESDSIEIITKSAGLDIEQLKIDSATKYDEAQKMQMDIFKMAAMAFDIPELVYFGNITEKSDASNEFVTYAIKPVVEIMNDVFNRSLVGYPGYVKGERIFYDFRHFKHVDIMDAAPSLDKLRAIGFSLDEIREEVNYEALGTDFSTKRALTKNYLSEDDEDETV